MLEQPASYQLPAELTLFALRTPRLYESPHSHHSGISAVTTEPITEAAERTGHELVQPTETTLGSSWRASISAVWAWHEAASGQ
ncbi:hypothetical protein [Streptomyces sp. NPDC001381]|uniref:hypothetical protein n=1 Tax=Streptomyces sp. NPDC001381 TaxID=3364567 RepID=UPI0036CB6DC0